MVTPAFVSEWQDHIVADCVPASGVMLANKISHNAYPASVAEREALQDAMGTQDEGADAAELAAGIKKRYGIALVPNVGGWTAIAAALTDPTRGTAIFGSYPQLPAFIRSHSLQPTFPGLHCMYAQADGKGLVTVGDPLGTAFVLGVQVGDLKPFCTTGLPGMALIGKETPLYGLVGWPDYARETLAGARAYAYRIFVNAHKARATALPGFWGASGWPLYARISYAQASAYALRIFEHNPSYRP